MINQINLSDIRTFVLIAELGNFTKAAEALEVSRSHVSKQISQLERQMGVTLLLRTTRTLKLTAAGEQFFHQCQTNLQGINQALLVALDDVEQVRGHIKINCVGGYLGEEIVASMLSSFMLQYPDVSLEMDFSSHRVDLISDQFDVAFRMGQLEDAGFIGKKLLDLEMVTLASPSYLSANGQALDHPKDLLQHNCLTGSVKKWHHQTVALPPSDFDVQVQGQFQCKNGRSLLNAAVAGCGLIRVPSIYCRELIEQGKLVKVMPDWQIPNVAFSAIYHKDRYQPKRLRLLIEHIQLEFEKL
ncbi:MULTISPECIES: LysR family transcriptional regulator [Vibrio]|uniref:LysR family transcriptional regulator n=1 Tax=Vibrio algicola TaxID=2662262 RepID=A0A5Q0TBT6_9VIBR|nr:MULTISPECIES: LysR family transcriptional regulator [Vibrio]MBD1575763.1 LysR family transcriptional regulator [Vibrio sp. S11_S32]